MVIRVFWTIWGELLYSGSSGCPIINPLSVAPTVQMVPEAHMASNPVIGILLSELPPTLLLKPPPLSLSIKASCEIKEHGIDQSIYFFSNLLKTHTNDNILNNQCLITLNLINGN